MVFKEFVTLLEEKIEEFQDFEITQKGGGFVWIGKKDGKIGNWTCHYEIIQENQKIFADMHFENKRKNDFLKLCTSKGYNNNPHHRKGIRFNSIGFELNEESIYKCFELFKNSYSSIGKELEQLLNEIYNNTLGELVEKYKTLLFSNPEVAIKGELYKWDLIKKCQTASYKEIINEVKKTNLVYSTNVSIMYNNFLKDVPEKTESLLKQLFDQNESIDKRFENYQATITEICNEQNYKVCVKDERTAMTFLTCKYPNEYTFFKPSVYDALVNLLDEKKKEGFLRVHDYLRIIDDLAKRIFEDEELKNELYKYLDSEHIYEKLVAQNVLWVYLSAEDKAWMPSDYSPNISTEQWIELINNKDIFTDKSLITFGCIYKARIATCADMEEEFGRTANFYNNTTWQTGERVHKATNCPLSERESKETRLWSVCCLGRERKDKRFEYKIRPELQKAFEKTGILNNIELYDTGDTDMSTIEYYKNLLLNTHNLILHGAPGTGKTYLAKEIAKAMGAEVGFVQFHPSFDYTDFVEGLRPVNSENGQIGFERKDGVFKKFCERALKNLIDSSKSALEIEKEKSIDEQINSFISDAIESNKEFEIATGNKFYVTDMTDRTIVISNPANEKTSLIYVSRAELQALLSSEGKIENGNDIRQFFERKWRTQQDSYTIVLYKKIKETKSVKNTDSISKMDRKDFVFIIDEINRGEMSKIFGELFFAIEPSYRGAKKCDNLRTQYANLQEVQNEFDSVLKITDKNEFGHFFIPENVYIIGTMNDIDRSVESMDFAFRRRFTFCEVKANDNLGMLDELDESVRDEAKSRLLNLNTAISNIEGLSSAYHIGGAYFLKLKELNNDFDKLWEYHLEGLLREYLRGMEDAEDLLTSLEKAYNDNSQSSNEENAGE